MNNVLPERGMIAVFNRSHYEDVLVTQVHHMEDGYAMPKRCTECGHEEFYKKRYRQIKDYEKYLYENGIVVSVSTVLTTILLKNKTPK